MSSNFELFWRELLFPLGFRFLDKVNHADLHVFNQEDSVLVRNELWSD